MDISFHDPSDFNSDDLSLWLKSGCLFSLNSKECYLGWGQFTSFDQAPKQRSSIYNPDFYLKLKKPWIAFEKSTILPREQLLRLLSQTLEPNLPIRRWQEPSLADFTNVFQQIKGLIDQGRFKKAVPIVFASSNDALSPMELKTALVNVVARCGQQTAYGIWQSTQGFLGLSPEKFFEMNRTELSTVALAGTMQADEQSNEAFLKDPKELSEHNFVVEDIESQLSGLGALKKSATKVWCIGLVSHLLTEITVQLMGSVGFEDLIKRLHPTAALGVLPRVKSLDELQFLECDRPRSNFGAPFGLQLNQERSIAIVAIRNISWSEEAIYLGSGCGLVKESVLEKEWKELQLKRSAVLSQLGFILS